jgi:hypothetical protein
MQKSATEVMQAVLFAAIVDAVEALKASSRGVPNTLLRDIQTLHPNTTFGDLPKELQTAIAESTRAAFARLLKEGYSVGPRDAQQQSRPIDRVPERQRRDTRPERRGPPGRGPRPSGRPGGGRPGGKPGGGKPGGGNPRG